MGAARGTYWRRGNEYRVSAGTCKGENHLQDPGVDGTIIIIIIIKWIFKK
jgi:hypothetical protein